MHYRQSRYIHVKLLNLWLKKYHCRGDRKIVRKPAISQSLLYKPNQNNRNTGTEEENYVGPTPRQKKYIQVLPSSWGLFKGIKQH